MSNALSSTVESGGNTTEKLSQFVQQSSMHAISLYLIKFSQKKTTMNKMEMIPLKKKTETFLN